MKRSQIQIITEQLYEHGEISRNACLRHYITRLAAIIHLLKQDGWEFSEERRERDYVYIVTKKPELKLF